MVAVVVAVVVVVVVVFVVEVGGGGGDRRVVPLCDAVDGVPRVCALCVEKGRESAVHLDPPSSMPVPERRSAAAARYLAGIRAEPVARLALGGSPPIRRAALEHN